MGREGFVSLARYGHALLYFHWRYRAEDILSAVSAISAVWSPRSASSIQREITVFTVAFAHGAVTARISLAPSPGA